MEKRVSRLRNSLLKAIKLHSENIYDISKMLKACNEMLDSYTLLTEQELNEIDLLPEKSIGLSIKIALGVRDALESFELEQTKMIEDFLKKINIKDIN